MILLEITKPTEKWNETVIKNNGSYSQTTYYADYIKQVVGDMPHFVVFADGCNGEQIGQLLFFKKRKFFILNKNYFNGEPVITNGCRPENTYDLIKSIIGRQLKPLKYMTSIIDLTLGQDEILKRADKHSVQKNIKRAVERGLVIKNITEDNEGLKDYARTLFESRKRLKIEKRSENDILFDIWNVVRDSPHNQIFVAYLGGNAVGGISCNIFNKTITERGIARTESDHSYSTEALRWALILHGINQGCTEYDLAGIPNNNPGVAKSKTKWNGKLREVTKFV